MRTEALGDGPVLPSTFTRIERAFKLPTFILGARLPTQPKPSSRHGISTVNIVYSLVEGTKAYPANPALNHIYVKDAAKAHVTTLSLGPLPEGRRKRFIITSAEKYNWLEISDLIRTERPDLAAKTVPKETELGPQVIAPFDTSLAAEYLGLKEYVSFKETLLETVDWVVDWEKTAKSA